jgi:peptidoglycan/LPS O-acetylase OafA/YrhL
MRSTLLTWFGTIVLLLVSLLASFFVVFNMIFSDIFGAGERIGSYVYAGVAYLVLGLMAGLAGPSRPRRWLWILSAPAVAILFLYTFSEPQNALIHLGFALLVPLAAHVGIRSGARLRSGKSAPSSVPKA